MGRIRHKMINCRSCIWYHKCKALEEEFREVVEQQRGNWRKVYYPTGGRVGTPIRRCSKAMIELHREIFNNKDVLEIGCGPLSDLNEAFCEAHRTRYVGIDPTRLPLFEFKFLPSRKLQTMLTFILARFGWTRWSKWHRYILDSFPSSKLQGMLFDTIYANSSIEHWHADLVDPEGSIQAYRADIMECHRLLKPGGVLMVTCPIYVHGNLCFNLGQVTAIEEFFGDEWSSIVFEHWREQHDDLLPYCPEKRREAFQARYGLIWTNIWTMNIVAVK